MHVQHIWYYDNNSQLHLGKDELHSGKDELNLGKDELHLGKRERLSLSVFLGTEDIGIHIVHISRVIITYTLE